MQDESTFFISAATGIAARTPAAVSSLPTLGATQAEVCTEFAKVEEVVEEGESEKGKEKGKEKEEEHAFVSSLSAAVEDIHRIAPEKKEEEEKVSILPIGAGERRDRVASEEKEVEEEQEEEEEEEDDGLSILESKREEYCIRRRATEGLESRDSARRREEAAAAARLRGPRHRTVQVTSKELREREEGGKRRRRGGIIGSKRNTSEGICVSASPLLLAAATAAAGPGGLDSSSSRLQPWEDSVERLGIGSRGKKVLLQQQQQWLKQQQLWLEKRNQQLDEQQQQDQQQQRLWLDEEMKKKKRRRRRKKKSEEEEQQQQQQQKQLEMQGKQPQQQQQQQQQQQHLEKEKEREGEKSQQEQEQEQLLQKNKKKKNEKEEEIWEGRLLTGQERRRRSRGEDQRTVAHEKGHAGSFTPTADAIATESILRTMSATESKTNRRLLSSRGGGGGGHGRGGRRDDDAAAAAPSVYPRKAASSASCCMFPQQELSRHITPRCFLPGTTPTSTTFCDAFLALEGLEAPLLLRKIKERRRLAAATAAAADAAGGGRRGGTANGSAAALQIAGRSSSLLPTGIQDAGGSAAAIAATTTTPTTTTVTSLTTPTVAVIASTTTAAAAGDGGGGAGGGKSAPLYVSGAHTSLVATRKGRTPAATATGGGRGGTDHPFYSAAAGAAAKHKQQYFYQLFKHTKSCTPGALSSSSERRRRTEEEQEEERDAGRSKRSSCFLELSQRQQQQVGRREVSTRESIASSVDARSSFAHAYPERANTIHTVAAAAAPTRTTPEMLLPSAAARKRLLTEEEEAAHRSSSSTLGSYTRSWKEEQQHRTKDLASEKKKIGRGGRGREGEEEEEGEEGEEEEEERERLEKPFLHWSSSLPQWQRRGSSVSAFAADAVAASSSSFPFWEWCRKATSGNFSWASGRESKQQQQQEQQLQQVKGRRKRGHQKQQKQQQQQQRAHRSYLTTAPAATFLQTDEAAKLVAAAVAARELARCTTTKIAVASLQKKEHSAEAKGKDEQNEEERAAIARVDVRHKDDTREETLFTRPAVAGADSHAERIKRRAALHTKPPAARTTAAAAGAEATETEMKRLSRRETKEDLLFIPGEQQEAEEVEDVEEEEEKEKEKRTESRLVQEHQLREIEKKKSLKRCATLPPDWFNKEQQRQQYEKERRTVFFRTFPMMQDEAYEMKAMKTLFAAGHHLRPTIRTALPFSFSSLYNDARIAGAGAVPAKATAQTASVATMPSGTRRRATKREKEEGGERGGGGEEEQQQQQFLTVAAASSRRFYPSKSRKETQYPLVHDTDTTPTSLLAPGGFIPPPSPFVANANAAVAVTVAADRRSCSSSSSAANAVNAPAASIASADVRAAVSAGSAAVAVDRSYHADTQERERLRCRSHHKKKYVDGKAPSSSISKKYSNKAFEGSEWQSKKVSLLASDDIFPASLPPVTAALSVPVAAMDIEEGDAASSPRTRKSLRKTKAGEKKTTLVDGPRNTATTAACELLEQRHEHPRPLHIERKRRKMATVYMPSSSPAVDRDEKKVGRIGVAGNATPSQKDTEIQEIGKRKGYDTSSVKRDVSSVSHPSREECRDPTTAAARHQDVLPTIQVTYAEEPPPEGYEDALAVDEDLLTGDLLPIKIHVYPTAFLRSKHIELSISLLSMLLLFAAASLVYQLLYGED